MAACCRLLSMKYVCLTLQKTEREREMNSNMRSPLLFSHGHYAVLFILWLMPCGCHSRHASQSVTLAFVTSLRNGSIFKKSASRLGFPSSRGWHAPMWQGSRASTAAASAAALLSSSSALVAGARRDHFIPPNERLDGLCAREGRNKPWTLRSFR